VPAAPTFALAHLRKLRLLLVASQSRSGIVGAKTFLPRMRFRAVEPNHDEKE
jgi:hypothetical protein